MVVSVGGHGSLIGAMLGEYEVEALIGRGAMGSVYLARDTKLNRRVALKVLLGSLARTPALVKQFHQEAHASAPLKHPGIVRIYSAGTEDGTPYIAMEFVDGEPLDRFLKRKGKVSWQVALHIGGKLAQALECAHRGGVVHRDVKPSNVMLDRRGDVRLTDFGIASIQSGDQGASSSTQILGTPQYMSPEQATGGDVGPSTDLFALGVMMYQMISGELPFRGESSMALIKSITEDQPTRLNVLDPSIPDDVARLVAYLIEKKIESRPANAKVVYGLSRRLLKQRSGESAVSNSLSAFLKEETESRPFSTVHSPGKRSKRRRTTIKKKLVAVRKASRQPRWAQLAVVALLAITGFAVAPVMSARERDVTPGRAATMELATFERTFSAGTKRLAVIADGYEPGRVSWVGNESIALLEVRGVEGSLAQEMKGLLAVDPVAEVVLSLHSPGDMSKPRRMDAGGTAPSFTIEVPPMPEDAPLSDSFLVHAREGRGGSIVTLAQRWDAESPDARVLFRSTEGAWLGPTNSSWAPAAESGIVLSPDGKTLCMLLYDEALGYRYLAERDVNARPLNRIGERRTRVGREIVPESIQYSPNGIKIAYLRRNVKDEYELWLLTSLGDEANGHLLTDGLLSEVFAFSPDSSLIAVIMRGRESGLPEVSLLDARLGEIVAQFGPGSLSREAWHPSGRYLAFLANAAAGPGTNSTAPPRQLYMAAIDDELSKTHITNVPGGLAEGYALSRDGRWAAAILADTKAPGLLLVDLRALEFDRPLGTG